MIKVLITGGNGQLGQSFRYWSSEFKDFNLDIRSWELAMKHCIKKILSKDV